MKPFTRTFSFICLLLALSLLSCKKDRGGSNQEPEIVVDASSAAVFSSGIKVEAEPSGGTFSKTVLFTATEKWTAIITGDGATGWVSLSPSSGAAGKVSMNVTVTSNGSESERRAEVKITCGSSSKSFMVIQDGKTVVGEPVVINVTKPEESGISIVSYDSSSNELVMEVTEDRIPQVGDIVCSGSTKEAPYGFLGEIESVTVIETKAGDDFSKKIVRAVFVSTSLYAIFQKLGIEVKQWFSLGEADASFTDTAGHSIEPVKDKEGIDVFSIHLPIKLEDDVKIDYTYELSVPRCSLYLDTTTPDMVIGFDMLIKRSELLHIKAGSKLKAKGELFDKIGWNGNSWVINSPPIPVGPIPVVITMQLLTTIPYEFSMTANLDMDVYKRVSYHHVGGYYHSISNSFEPLEGNAPFLEILDGSDEGEYQPEYSDREFSATLEGKMDLGVDFGCSFGLWGGNIDKDGDYSTGFNYLAVGFNAGLKAEINMSLGGLMNLDEDSRNAVRIIDEMKAKGSIYGKIWGTALSTDVLGADIQVLSGEKEWDIYKEEKYSSFFFPYYSKLKVNSITRQDFLNVSGRKHKSATQLIYLFKEQDFGLCLESADGLDYYVCSLKDHPMNEEGEFSIDIPVEVSNLRSGIKYSVYPYSKVGNFLGIGREKMVCRKGISFTISDSGQLSTAVIDDVPGVLL